NHHPFYSTSYKHPHTHSYAQKQKCLAHTLHSLHNEERSQLQWAVWVMEQGVYDDNAFAVIMQVCVCECVGWCVREWPAVCCVCDMKCVCVCVCVCVCTISCFKMPAAVELSHTRITSGRSGAARR